MSRKGRWLAVVVAAALPSQLAFAANGGPAPAANALLHLHDNITDFRVTGGASGAKRHGVEGAAALDFDLGPVTASVTGRAITSRDPATGNSRTSHSRGELRLDTVWHDRSTRLALKAVQTVQTNVRDGSTGGALYVEHLESEAGTQTASATAKFKPLPQVRVEIGADAEDQATSQRQWQAGATPTTSRVETRTGREFAKARWRPVPYMAIDAEMAAQSTTLSMVGTVSGSTAYRTADTQLKMTLTPWHGGALTLGLAGTETPLNASTFAAYAAATGRPAGAGLKPDSARAVHVGVTQTLGDALALKADYRNAQLDSTTVLIPAASGQMPASISGGRRQRFSAALTLSLDRFGLADTELISKAVWQRSHITDPLTGQERRISGETPHRASFRLSQALPQHHLRWGLIGRLGSETRYYQVSQETTVARGGSVGAFVEYNPGPFKLRLDVAGLAGSTAQTSAVYAGERGASPIIRFGHSQQSSTTVGISLTKSLDG